MQSTDRAATPSRFAGSRPGRLLLTGHIIVTVALIGAAFVLVGLGVSGLRGADPRTIFPAAHMVDAWVVAPLAILALTTGITQAFLTGRGLTNYWWVVIKLATTALATVAVVFVLEPRLAGSAEAALAGQSYAPGEFLPLVVASSVAVVLLVTNVILGMYKPGRRLRARPQRGVVA